MSTYHVKMQDGKILAGTTNKNCKWTDVTEEALAAARDHLLYMTIQENTAISYSWHYPNGKTILLKLEERDTSEIHDKDGQDIEATEN